MAQLKAELDGVAGKNTGIVILACTNHASSIDQALLRPGRISTRLRFRAPDIEGKAQLIEHHVTRQRTAGSIDARALGQLLQADATAATVAESVDTAWQSAVRRSIALNTEPSLTQSDLENSLIDHRLGERTSGTSVSWAARWRTAVHEAGHAVVRPGSGGARSYLSPSAETARPRGE